MPICNWEKFGVPEQLHIILNGVYCFYEKKGRLPGALNEEDANELVAIVKEYNTSRMEI